MLPSRDPFGEPLVAFLAMGAIRDREQAVDPVVSVQTKDMKPTKSGVFCIRLEGEPDMAMPGVHSPNAVVLAVFRYCLRDFLNLRWLYDVLASMLHAVSVGDSPAPLLFRVVADHTRPMQFRNFVAVTSLQKPADARARLERFHLFQGERGLSRRSRRQDMDVFIVRAIAH